MANQTRLEVGAAFNHRERTSWRVDAGLRRLACAVAVLGLVGCGGKSGDAGNSAGQGGDISDGGADGDGGSAADGAGQVGVAPDDPDCKRLGVSYQATCDDCPSTPISCPCFDASMRADVHPLPRCNGSRCVLGVECAEVCKGSDLMTLDATVQYYDNLSQLQRCVTDPICRSDAWCGDHGKCVGEPVRTVRDRQRRRRLSR
jgi:hypothetical protein